MTPTEIIEELRALGDPTKLAVLERFGIRTTTAFGISTPELKTFAKELRKIVADRHFTAQQLWETGIYEARALAFLIDDPKRVTPDQMEAWVADLDNWATVDGVCSNLFCRTPYAYSKAIEWAERETEFEKRAGFSLMAYLAVHDKKAPDEKLAAFLPIIEKHAYDGRNFVRKAVNWALRQIGKRSVFLNKLAIAAAEDIRLQDSVSARWIASDASRELASPVVQERLKKKAARSTLRE